jgi:hypothetical protein
MTMTVREWRAWTGMVFPAIGEYIIPSGLSTLQIAIDEDRGTFTDPSVWVGTGIHGRPDLVLSYR